MRYLFWVLSLLYAGTLYGQDDQQAIYAEVRGSGEPVLLIPGFTVPGDSWESTVVQLEKDYECHIITLAGFGGKAAIDFPWLPKVNKALLDYINDNDLKEVTLIGHSLGGTIATWLASRENSPVAKLILVDALPATGALIMPNYNPDYLVYDNPYSKQQLNMSAADFENMLSGMAQGMSLNKETQLQIKDWMLMADRKTYVYGYTDYLKLDMRSDLSKISVPVTIIAADTPYGEAMIRQTYESQYANLENYNLIIAENSAHFVMFDRPDWFAEQLQQILLSK